MCMYRAYVYMYLHMSLLDMYVRTYMVCCIYPRVHAGIDEMDVFINIDLNTFLDVRHVHHVYTIIINTRTCVHNVCT